MNNQRRKAIDELKTKLDEIRMDIETVMNEEQEYYDNMPESFKYGEKGEKAEAAISSMEDAINSIDDTLEGLESSKE